MHKILTRTPIEAEGGHVDLDFRDTSTWTEFGGIPSLSMLFGDEEAGPYVFLSSSTPMVDQMPTGFAHAHASDNWRISVRGTTNMGRDAYAHGEFRFHDGGVPYASDNLTWGPDGGFGLVLMGDRRGFAINPVKAEVAERVDPTQEKAARFMGIERLDPCPGAPAIRTTTGPTTRAHQNGGFGDLEGWLDIAPGVKLFAGLLGEPQRGPVVCLVSADAGAVAWPRRALDTETLLVPIDGAAEADGVVLDQGSIRVEASRATAPALVAGIDGLQLTAVVGDRRALLSEPYGFADDAFASALAAHVADLIGDLTA